MAESLNTTPNCIQQHRYNRDHGRIAQHYPKLHTTTFPYAATVFVFKKKILLTFKSIFDGFLDFSNFDESRKKWRKQ